MHLNEFRTSVIEFITAAASNGTACPAFGAILPTGLHDAARAWQQAMYEGGFAGLHWPEAYGGRGLTKDHSAIWFEECARHGVAPYVNLQGNILAGEAIIRSGTDAQQRKFLDATLRADILWCQLFSEPGAGSDLGGLQATAELDGDNYVLNGQKVWSSNAQFAEYGILMARTDPDLPKHRGISFFLLDMALAGIDIRPLKQMTGDEEFCEVFFDDVAMPSDALLGPINGGWGVAMAVLQDERGSFGQAGVISFEKRLERLTGLRSDNPVTRDGVSALVARGHALKAMLLRVGESPVAAPAAKLMRTELEVTANAIEAELRGPAAMLLDARTEAFLYSPGMRIAGGSSEIQRNIIGERVLGLPRQ